MIINQVLLILLLLFLRLNLSFLLGLQPSILFRFEPGFFLLPCFLDLFFLLSFKFSLFRFLLCVSLLLFEEVLIRTTIFFFDGLNDLLHFLDRLSETLLKLSDFLQKLNVVIFLLMFFIT